MKTLYKEISQKVDALSRRERVILFATMAALVYFILQSLLIDPLFNKQADIQKQLNAANKQYEELKTQTKLLTYALQVGPNKQERLDIIRLENQLDVLNKKMASRTNELLSPTKMIGVLEEVILAEKNLTLVALTNTPVETLVQGKKQTDGTSTSLYKHGIEMVFKGPYSAVYQFLTKIEAKPWRFFWESMIYEVGKYPNANVTLKVYTLSTEKGWIGV